MGIRANANIADPIIQRRRIMLGRNRWLVHVYRKYVHQGRQDHHEKDGQVQDVPNPEKSLVE